MQCAVYGNFSAPKAQEIIVSRGKVLELLRPDETGRLQTILSTEVGTTTSFWIGHEGAVVSQAPDNLLYSTAYIS